MTTAAFPHGKRFAFTILDDTDVATVDNVEPVYRLLLELGMRTTKTVWPLGCPEGSRNFSSSQTLEDAEYLEMVRGLADRGVEITWHGATMESSERGRTHEALERFRELFGGYPRIHANHSYNRENVYWGTGRVDQPVLKALVRRAVPTPPDHYQGHVPGSPFWWGDLCSEHIEYARNLTFNEVDLFRVNPSMPYRDPARPLVRWWFSCADAEDRDEFNELLRPSRVAKLVEEGGCCIVATHLGKGFARNGEVDRLVRRRLEALAAADGWFVPVGELLDWLRARRDTDDLPADEWDRMQWRWARDLMRRKLRRGTRRVSG
ncbi:MAG TPA: hypothetical protein VFE05_13130 [Longimicrobiaceae bacterium]|jgi:hypothetical protein|nr:hypothetical protein [Longimicrobiaceae bacterium]